MKPLDYLLAALDSLRANILRSALTTLGIIIGVGAVIAMVAVGSGAERRMQEVIQSLGSNILIVINGTSVSGGARGGSGSRVSLTEEDAAAIAREIPAVQVAAPTVRGSAQAVFGNTNWFTTINGVTREDAIAQDWVIRRGRGLTDADLRGAAKVALVGQTVVEKLFAGEDPLDQVIRIKRVPFTVVGVMAEKGQTPFGSDQDDAVFIPLSTAKKRVLGGARISGQYVGRITVKARRAGEMAEIEEEVKALLRQRHRIRPGQPDDFQVRNIAQLLEARSKSERTMAWLLASVAGVSLIVGGIGIMNIMLVSVTERTREIGLRIAVGARRRDILAQFAIEAVAMALLGGLLGVALGVGGSLVAAQLGNWPMVIEPAAIAMAIGYSAAIGIFFGYYPARKASRLNPIEALRHE